MNKIERIIKINNPDKRDECYWNLYEKLVLSKGADRLNIKETFMIFNYLRNNTLSARERNWIWKLQILGTPHEKIKDYALTCIEKEESYTRGLAFYYIQKHYPNSVNDLVEKYKNDKSPHIKYRIASTIKNPSDKLKLLKSILPNVGFDHELGERVSIEIYELEKI